MLPNSGNPRYLAVHRFTVAKEDLRVYIGVGLQEKY